MIARRLIRRRGKRRRNGPSKESVGSVEEAMGDVGDLWHGVIISHTEQMMMMV